MDNSGDDFKPLEAAKLFMKIIGFVKPFVHYLLLTIFLNTIFALFTAISVTIIQPIFQIIFNVKEAAPAQGAGLPKGILTEFLNYMKSVIEVPGDMQATLIQLGIFTIAVFIFKNTFKYLGSIYSVKLEEGVIKSIRDKIFANMTSLSVDFFSKSKSGTLISVITNDVNALNGSTISTFTVVIRNLIQVVSYIVVLLGISVKLTLITFSTSIISFVIIRYSMKYIRRYASRMQRAMADYTSTLQETIFGIRVVKAYNAEDSANKRFGADTGKFVKSAVKHKKIIALIPSINEIFAILALCVVLFVGGIEVINGKMQPDYLMLFMFALFSIMSPLSVMINSLAKYQRGFVAAKRVFSVLDRTPTVKDGNIKAEGFENEIRVDNLTFAYENNSPVIKNADITLPKSRKIAFVGPSGSGKSTMLDLIIRFYDPDTGSIKIDGRDIRDLNIESYRSMFGIVAQESMLFNDTVANNISFGYPDATMDEIIEAAKISNAYDFIINLPDGFDTVIGDRGVLLSGGEKQRVSIARALVRNPKIIVFDEATSSLDSESEKVVQEAINTSLKDRSAIIVAHRLATIIDCDEIIVFDQGEIVERGTHSELLANNKVYRKLYEIQFTRKELGEEY